MFLAGATDGSVLRLGGSVKTEMLKILSNAMFRYLALTKKKRSNKFYYDSKTLERGGG
jgi:hypothetical protein